MKKKKKKKKKKEEKEKEKEKKKKKKKRPKWFLLLKEEELGRVGSSRRPLPSHRDPYDKAWT